jgi:hypothetical protein
VHADPAEQDDLSETYPAVAAELLRMLQGWRNSNAQITGEPDPITTQGLSLPYERFMARLLARQHGVAR